MAAVYRISDRGKCVKWGQDWVCRKNQFLKWIGTFIGLERKDPHVYRHAKYSPTASPAKCIALKSQFLSVPRKAEGLWRSWGKPYFLSGEWGNPDLTVSSHSTCSGGLHNLWYEYRTSFCPVRDLSLVFVCYMCEYVFVLWMDVCGCLDVYIWTCVCDCICVAVSMCKCRGEVWEYVLSQW